MTDLPPAARVALIVALLLPCAASGADDIFANRPAFSEAEQAPKAYATCEQLRKMSAGLPELEYRIDLAMVGALTAVKTDGALWYLTMCTDVRVMCVTYQSNDMKPGDTVYLKGGYARLDPNHVMLDPCLANRRDADGK